MLNDVSKQIKYKRILFYWGELARHRVDIDTALDFMQYMFSVSKDYIVQIVKGYYDFDKTVALDHSDIDILVIEAFVQKLFKQARNNRRNEVQTKIEFEKD
ncbi:MAG: hypothetical protein Q7U54_07955 [Bacteroidales bacterium]|nr:hypothetical protein [Bacteroidales bacterium]